MSVMLRGSHESTPKTGWPGDSKRPMRPAAAPACAHHGCPRVASSPVAVTEGIRERQSPHLPGNSNSWVVMVERTSRAGRRQVPEASSLHAPGGMHAPLVSPGRGRHRPSAPDLGDSSRRQGWWLLLWSHEVPKPGLT